MLKASTPGGHASVSALWIASATALAASAVTALGSSDLWRPLVALAVLAFGLGTVVYAIRHAIFLRTLSAAEQAVERGDSARARRVLAPLLARFPDLEVVQAVSASVLYETGDPLSAAALYERAMKRLGPAGIAPRLVASYAALNKGGDARRAAAAAPADVDVRLALAWSETVALAGDRARGEELISELESDVRVLRAPGRIAMLRALAGVVSARRRDRDAVGRAIAEAERIVAALPAPDRAFIGYLAGVAWRETGAVDDARRAFDAAVETAPETIGSALARRERSHLR